MVVGDPVRGDTDADRCARPLSSTLLSVFPTDATVMAIGAGLTRTRPVRASQMRDGSPCNGLAASDICFSFVGCKDRKNSNCDSWLRSFGVRKYIVDR